MNIDDSNMVLFIYQLCIRGRGIGGLIMVCKLAYLSRPGFCLLVGRIAYLKRFLPLLKSFIEGLSTQTFIFFTTNYHHYNLLFYYYLKYQVLLCSRYSQYTQTSRSCLPHLRLPIIRFRNPKSRLHSASVENGERPL